MQRELNQSLAINQTLNNELKEARAKVDALSKQ